MARVFISYRRSDLPEIERLADEIRAAGHNVWFDEWEIRLGDSIVQRMEEGLESATHLVLCCSAAGVNTRWMSREWMSALARQLNGVGVRVLPVLLAGSAPPAILADLRYVDLGRDWSTGVHELLRALR